MSDNELFIKYFKENFCHEGDPSFESVDAEFKQCIKDSLGFKMYCANYRLFECKEAVKKFLCLN